MRTTYEWESGAVAAGAVINSLVVDAKPLSEISVLVDNSDSACVTDRDLVLKFLARDGSTSLFQTTIPVKQKTRKAIIVAARAFPTESLSMDGTGAVKASSTVTLTTGLAAGEKLSLNGHDLVAQAKFATATVAFDTLVADNVVTIGGQAFTAKVSATTSVQFALGESDAEALANLAAKVNAHATIGLVVQMDGTSGVVTSVVAGAPGNLVTITGTAVRVGITGDSGGKLSGAYDASLNQWPVEATLPLSAAALSAAVNAATTAGLAGYVSAQPSGATVVVSSSGDGLLGNQTTCTVTGDHLAATGSGKLAGGAAATESVVVFVPMILGSLVAVSLAAGGARPAQVAVYGRR